jgi:diazepam-binding inhibitor (GABA receptor modulating acyl-CoA-binding protein)
MSLSEKFQQKAEEVKGLTKRPDNEELLRLYGLYKQATVGDNSTDRPSFFLFKEKSKWEAWTDQKGLTREEAQSRYVDLVNELQIRCG